MADELSGLDRLLDLEHVCAVLGGISRSKLYALARQNRLLLRKIDRLTRVRESDLVAFMATISEGRLESPIRVAENQRFGGRRSPEHPAHSQGPGSRPPVTALISLMREPRAAGDHDTNRSRRCPRQPHLASLTLRGDAIEPRDGRWRRSASVTPRLPYLRRLQSALPGRSRQFWPGRSAL